ncbi:hypothetical protein HBI55_245870 [Parastagonospora nodorum]|nr:hypothetical protein HBI28_215940 [Parastagonospora nodorum]KAH5618600.1 hypothetical protein HBI22_233290 [Parastagonospora nodorum]KAH6084845.1 hypothetical protein HBI66_052020 [Parastagonospora nodorum]KAH6086608.1 hypothetical protein HBI67_016190 [Parastagonospora nodorum]KAH6481200.1 hypothetical protein HBI55_245870 [Parastagonospora nodorum]
MSSYTSFTVSKVDLEKDWNELMSIFWTSWKTPLQASGELTFPYLGSDTPEEAVAYGITSAGLLSEAKQNVDNILWYKATENLTNKIVGGLCLKVERKWPNSDGQCLFVLLEYRSTGVAKQLIDSGIIEADSLGLEVFLEGTTFSTPGLLRVGFIVIGWVNLVFARRNPSKDWTRLVNELQSHPISIMWRPRLGRYIEGETLLPWTGKTRNAKL